jgi:hypothetical protein
LLPFNYSFIVIIFFFSYSDVSIDDIVVSDSTNPSCSHSDISVSSTPTSVIIYVPSYSSSFNYTVNVAVDVNVLVVGYAITSATTMLSLPLNTLSLTHNIVSVLISIRKGSNLTGLLSVVISRFGFHFFFLCSLSKLVLSLHIHCLL